MTIRRQHYVPRVYLKSWETQVVKKKEPNNPFKGVYYFEKSDLGVGDGRNKDSILWEPRLYNIDFELSFIIKSCPLIEKDYIKQVAEKLEERKVNAFHLGKILRTSKEMATYFFELDNWDFKYKATPFNIAVKKAILNKIKQINSYVIEKALDDVIEKNWAQCLNAFINEMENTIPLNGVDEVRRINENIVIDMIKMVFFLICRNPNFDYMGILPKIFGVFSAILSDIASSERTKEFLEKQRTAIWLKEIYNGLFKVPNGYFHTMKKTAQKDFQIILYKCWEGEGSFITSDIPAFEHLSLVEYTNLNSIICPLTPQYILLLMRGEKNSLRDVNFRRVNNDVIRRLNRIILNHSKKALVANQRYLGYLL